MYKKNIPIELNCGLDLVREVLYGKWKLHLLYFISEGSELFLTRPAASVCLASGRPRSVSTAHSFLPVAATGATQLDPGRRTSSSTVVSHTKQTIAQDSGLQSTGWQLLIVRKGDYESPAGHGADARDHFCVDYRSARASCKFCRIEPRFEFLQAIVN